MVCTTSIDGQTRKRHLVSLRHQYGTAITVAGHINQELHITCDEAIANLEKLFAAGFTVSLRRPGHQLRTVPPFKAVQALLDMLEQARIAISRHGLQHVPILLGALQTWGEPGHGRIFIPSVIQLIGKPILCESKGELWV